MRLAAPPPLVRQLAEALDSFELLEDVETDDTVNTESEVRDGD